MYVDQFVNGTEIDGLTPLHLALSNGVLYVVFLCHTAAQYGCLSAHHRHLYMSE
jgi:hypothetical protein